MVIVYIGSIVFIFDKEILHCTGTVRCFEANKKISSSNENYFLSLNLIIPEFKNKIHTNNIRKKNKNLLKNVSNVKRIVKRSKEYKNNCK